MQPTYSFEEVHNFLMDPTLNYEECKTLVALIQEEQNRFSLDELITIEYALF